MGFSWDAEAWPCLSGWKAEARQECPQENRGMDLGGKMSGAKNSEPAQAKPKER